MSECFYWMGNRKKKCLWTTDRPIWLLLPTVNIWFRRLFFFFIDWIVQLSSLHLFDLIWDKIWPFRFYLHSWQCILDKNTKAWITFFYFCPEMKPWSLQQLSLFFPHLYFLLLSLPDLYPIFAWNMANRFW